MSCSYFALILTTLIGFSVAKNESNLCHTPACVSVSRLLKGLIDENRPPCEDFYKFACGRRTPDHPLLSLIQQSVIGYAAKRIDSTIRQALAAASQNRRPIVNGSQSDSTAYPAAVRAAVSLFTQCFGYQEQKKNATSQQNILSYFVNFAKWPLLTANWTSADFDLADVVGRMKATHRLNPLFLIDVHPNPLNADQMALLLFAPHFDYPFAAYNTSAFHDLYKLNISRALQQLVLNGVAQPMRMTEVNAVAEEIAHFETSLAMSVVTTLPQGSPADIFHPVTLQELNSNFSINSTEELNSTDVWRRFFVAAFRDDPLAISYLERNKVIIGDLPYFKSLREKLVGAGHVPMRTVANYLMWRLLARLAPFFDPNVLYIQPKTVTSATPSDFGAKCFAHIASTYRRALDWLYVNEKRAELEEKREALKIMLNDVFTGAAQIFNESLWLNEDAKANMLLKLRKMRTILLYPDWLTNVTLLDKLYAQKDAIDPRRNYFENLLSASQWDFSDLTEEDQENRYMNTYPFGYSTPNAAYVRELNAFLIAFGIAEDTFFRLGAPDAFNYGSLGAVIAHELSHGYDNFGMMRDADGNQTTYARMLGNSTAEFEARTACVVDIFSKKCYPIQFKETLLWQGEVGHNLHKRAADGGDNKNEDDASAYVIKQQCINGKKCLPEDFADISGIRIAWNAYQIAKARNSEQNADNFRLYGLKKYTPDQLFFLSYAKSLCAADPTAAELQSILHGTNIHSPADARVNVNLGNFEHFARTWKCDAKSRMIKQIQKPCRIY